MHRRRGKPSTARRAPEVSAFTDLDAILNWAEEPEAAPPDVTALPKAAPPDAAVPPDAVPLEAAPLGAAITTLAAPIENGDGYFTAAMYDPAAEEKEYCRALMSPDDLERLKEEIARLGFLTIEMVRELISQNTVKESQEARGETYAIDPEMMMQIDTRTNFRIFIAGDNVYSREELLAHFPFREMCTSPEDVFVQQEIGVFPPRKWAMDDKSGEGLGYEFVARDVGDPEEFVMIEDLVGRAARKNYTARRAPVRVVKTKVYLGKERWEEFSLMKRFVQSCKTFIAPMIAASRNGNAGAAQALTYLFGAAANGGPLALQDAEGARLDRERQALAALEAKARALQAKEDELRRREEDLFRSLGIDPPPRPPRDFMAEAAGGPEAAPAAASDSVSLDDAIPF